MAPLTAPLKMPAEHADLVVEVLVFRSQGVLEGHTGTDADGLQNLTDLLLGEVTLIRELREQRQATDRGRVKSVMKEHMDNMQHSVGYEHTALLRVQAGDRDYFPGDMDQAEAEKYTRDRIKDDAREALLAREVFEAIRDDKDEVRSLALEVIA